MSRLLRFAAVYLSLLPVVALAQSTANLSGTVTDPSGAVLPHAHVKAHSLATGADRDVDTDAAGLYAIPSLQPGDYSLQATAPGFAPYTVKKLTLNVDQNVTVNVQLPVQSAGETVQVESTATQIETQTITVGQVIDRTTVQQIPLNGRHFLDLTVLTPGGVVAPTAGNLTAASRGLGANSFITAGNREDTVNFQINGINLNDMSQNQITFQPSINTTSEFKVNNSTFSAEYGRSSGSIVNVATRSGTNQFHGEVFDYFRNDALDARNYFNRNFSPSTGASLGVTGKKAPLKRNNFGVAIGGPIWRNKTFFFFSYEGLRQHQGILQNSTVLSAAQRAATVAAGKPAANALLAIIPVANSGNNYVSFTPGPVQIDQYTGDFLQHFSPSDQLHGFYAFQKDLRTEPALQGDTVPGFGDHRSANRQVLTINETHIFSPNVVNEARLGFNRITIAFTPNFTPNPTSFNLGDGINTSMGIPQTTLQDIGLVFGGPSGFPQGRFDTLGVFSDTATLLRGKNTIKFGGEFRRFLEASFAGDIGTLTYASTANNFEQDTATGFTIQPTVITSRIYTNAAGVFVQDNYKLSSNFNIEAGLRFEWNGTPSEGENRFVIFNPANLTLDRVGTNGIDSVYKQNYNLEPRVGMVVDLFGNGRSVVRAGYGYLVDQPTETNVSGLATNPPFSTSVSYNNASAPIPVSSLYASAKAAGIAVANVNPNFRNSYTQTFNLNFQQALPGGMVSSIGYYGSVGRHLRVRTNQNQPINGGARPYLALSSTSPIDPGVAINTNISEANSVGSSNYNATWLTVAKNMGHGLEFNANYEWAKSLDTNSLGSQGGYTLQDSYNPGNNYGLSDFDVRHHFAGTAIYNLPSKGNQLLSGYQLSTIIQYQTGNPVNVLASSSTYTGVTAIVRPNLVGRPVTHKQQVAGLTNVTFIQNPGGLAHGGTVCDLTNYTPACVYQVVGTQPSATAATAPTLYTGIGNMQRNSVIGPGFADLDLSAEKDTKIVENLSFRLRIDAFDIFNHPNFGQPSGNVQSATFGQITATRFAVSDGGSSRQLQISGKFTF
ncbi:MAG TPA: carboxypeptidase regulatory-like domain-containing protein [Acidobacteriaceae bacterium]|nr:carboxypeptidase regulatory-like domain-containing protein [Acidobacteriaceae bacterium]